MPFFLVQAAPSFNFILWKIFFETFFPLTSAKKGIDASSSNLTPVLLYTHLHIKASFMHNFAVQKGHSNSKAIVVHNNILTIFYPTLFCVKNASNACKTKTVLIFSFNTKFKPKFLYNLYKVIFSQMISRLENRPNKTCNSPPFFHRYCSAYFLGFLA